MINHPRVIVLSGPNGAGKSTAAAQLLKGTLAVKEFVNADVIARGLSAFNSEAVAIQAGRIMLARLHELADARVSFAFETTLASRSFARWIRELKETGYLFHLVYIWLPSAELAISRVRQRVMQKGHHVPDDVVRRRYERGRLNFLNLYLPLADTWAVYLNKDDSNPRTVCEGAINSPERVSMPDVWNGFKSGVYHGT